MPGALSLKLTLGVLNAVAIIIVASLTLSISLSTSLSALGAIGERHARTLMSIARDDTEALFRRGTDVVGSLSNLSSSQDWVAPTSTTQPLAANRTLDTVLGAVHSSFIPVVNQFRSISVFLADGSDVHALQSDTNAAQYLLQLNIPPHPLHNASTANNTVSIRWRKTYDKATHQLLTPEWSRSGVPSSPSPLLPLWAEFTQGTFNGYAPVVFPPNAFINPDDGTLRRVTGAIAPFYAPSAPSRTAVNLGGFVLTTFSLDSLTAFVHDAKATPLTEVFAYDSLGFLLAATPTAPSYDVRPDSTTIPTGCSSTSRLSDPGTDPSTFRLICQRRITQYPSPDLNALAAGDAALVFPAVGVAPVVATMLPDGGRTFVASARVGMAFRGLEVYLMLLMPEADVLGDVVTGRNVAIGVTCALVVLFAAVNAAVAWLLLAPLGAVAARMERAARFEDDASVESVSAMAEVAALQKAYYAMNDELNRIRSFVPQSVLVARRSDVDDEDDPDMASLDGSAGADGLAASQPLERSRSSRSLRRTSLTASHRDTAPPVIAPSIAPAAAALTMRNISVVCGNVVGLHDAAGNTSRIPGAVGDDLAVYIGLVEAVVAAERGVVSFHGDRFLAAFNTSRPCVSHAVRAATAALRITGARGLGESTTTSPSSPFRLPVSCGIATGRCAVGSVGSATLKTMSAVGPAVAHAASLERYAHALITARDESSGVAVASQRCVREMAGSPIAAQIIDLADFRDWNAPASAKAAPTCVAELHPPLPTAAARQEPAAPGDSPHDGEWLYLVSGAEADPRLAFNGVFTQLAAGAFDAARATYASLTQAELARPPPKLLRSLFELESTTPIHDSLRTHLWTPRQELRTRVTSAR